MCFHYRVNPDNARLGKIFREVQAQVIVNGILLVRREGQDNEDQQMAQPLALQGKSSNIQPLDHNHRHRKFGVNPGATCWKLLKTWLCYHMVWQLPILLNHGVCVRSQPDLWRIRLGRSIEEWRLSRPSIPSLGRIRRTDWVQTFATSIAVIV